MSKDILVAKNIKKSFNKKQVLKSISISCQKGQITSILGASGSGKSTFLRCLNLLEIPDSGQIILDNKIIHYDKNNDTQEIKNLRKKVAMVFQNFNLWSHLNVLQNVTHTLKYVLKMDKKLAIDIAMEKLNKVGMVEFIDYFPIQLSGGQRQRVAIARALAVSPEVILFDEPTSSLDPELVKEILEVIKSLANEQVTMVIVTHELAFAKEISDKIMYINQGEVEEYGETEKLFNNPSSADFTKFIKTF